MPGKAAGPLVGIRERRTEGFKFSSEVRDVQSVDSVLKALFKYFLICYSLYIHLELQKYICGSG